MNKQMHKALQEAKRRYPSASARRILSEAKQIYAGWNNAQ